jgi:pimeloyl-ACP methyl ester carboxylesterase
VQENLPDSFPDLMPLGANAESGMLSARCIAWVLGHAAIVTFGFVLHYFDAATRDGPLKSLSIYVQAWLLENWYSLAVGLSWPLGFVPSFGTHRYDPHGGPPIVLVHGYCLNRACMFAIYWRLRRKGYSNIYPVNIRPAFADLTVLGTTLAKQLGEICSACDGEEAIVVGHSQGGLLARWCHERTDAPIAQVITLGSPHSGTRMAVFGLGPNAAQFRPDSAFLSDLSDKPDFLTSLYSEMDQLVVPSSSSKLGTTVLLPDMGHLTMLYQREAFDALLAQLPGVTLPKG